MRIYGWMALVSRGQLATDGVTRDADAQAAHARSELAACVPWIDWREAEISCHRYDRAEPRQSGGRRPDEAFVSCADDLIVCWPTKLSLTPDLGDRVIDCLPPPAGLAEPGPLAIPPVALGQPPWSR